MQNSLSVTNEELTNIILEMPIREKPSYELRFKFLSKLIEMWINDDWILAYAMVITDTNGVKRFGFQSLETEEGCFLMMLSHPKYFKKKFSSNMMTTSIRELFDVYFRNKEELDGIIINPDTDEQIGLDKSSMEILNELNSNN